MKKKIFMMALVIICVLCMSAVALAADATFEVDVTNNADKKKDVVVVTGVEPKSTVSVYSEKNILLGKKAAGSNSNSVSINVTLPSADPKTGGTITISVLAKGTSEAATLAVPYEAEPVSETPETDDVTITNNVDKKSTVYIENLDEKDAITVYNEKGKKLSTGKVGKNKDDVTISITKNKLDKTGGTLYITVKSDNKQVSEKKGYVYSAQTQSPTPSEANVEITNNTSKKGTIVVSDLESGDVITVYNAATDKKMGSKKCASSKDEVTLSTTLLKTGGTLKVTLKKTEERESEPLSISYGEQEITPALTDANITISTYPTGTKDTIYIDGLEGSDVIKVYTTTTGTTTLLKSTVSSSKDSLTLSSSSLTNNDYLYISVTRKNKLESSRLKVAVPAVNPSADIVPADVTITNNANMASTVYVTGLAENVTVTAYNKAKGGSKLGSTKVPAGNTTVTVSISQLSAEGGSIWLTRKDTDCNESNPVEISYSMQVQTVFSDISFESVEVTNNSGSASTITVSGLESGDVINAYSSSTTNTTLATATCGTYNDTVTLSTSSLDRTGGTVYLTRAEPGYLESVRKSVAYGGIVTTQVISQSQVSITNNTGIASTMIVTNLSEGDVITIYSAQTSGTVLGSGTVAAYSSSVTFNVSSLSSGGGSVWVSRKSSGAAESGRVEITYSGVEQSDAVENADIEILNNASASDTITVRGLDSGDVIKVYKDESTTSTFGTATASSGGSVTINISQLGSEAGLIYITRTGSGKTESSRTAASYSAESKAPKQENITVTNNVNTDSLVYVSGLASGDVVKVYSSSSASTPIGSASVASSGDVTVKVGQLSASSGKVYVTVTNYGCCESSRTAQDYAAQKTTNTPDNIATSERTYNTVDIVISNIQSGDYIRVYSDQYGSTVLGGATADDTSLTIRISGIGTYSGTVYVSNTRTGMHESERKTVGYGTFNE